MSHIDSPEVVIIGGGLAGLNCASLLAHKGREFVLVEKSDRVGGRVRTDVVDGFRLDRGFQVLLNAYPEARRVFNNSELDYQSFYPGALVNFENRFHRVADPYRRFLDAVESFLNPIGTPLDKFRVRQMRRRALEGRLKDVFDREEVSSMAYLEQRGFSRSMVDRFFRPFLGGVFLENELETSSRQLEFVFRMFALGETVVPRYGMGMLSESLARQIPDGCLWLNTEVEDVGLGRIQLVDGRILAPETIVVAVEGPMCAKWMGKSWDPGSRGTRTVYFAADQAPIEEPVLVLNGNGGGPVNHMCVMSEVSPSYAPSGQSLISVNVVDQKWWDETDSDLERAIRKQMEQWFGVREVQAWTHLRTYNISHAQPNRSAIQTPSLEISTKEVQNGIYICGDHVGGVSINGALRSGRIIAEQFSNP